MSLVSRRSLGRSLQKAKPTFSAQNAKLPYSLGKAAHSRYVCSTLVHATKSSRLLSLHVIGRPSTEYVSEETPMISYANLHLAFEQMRVRARIAQRGSPVQPGSVEAKNHPPRVLVLGPEHSGKTTAGKILTNYAVRAGQRWSPMLINLDPGEVWACQQSRS